MLLLQEDTLEKIKVDSNFQSGDSPRLEMFQNQLHGQLHIGPSHLCTEFYELAINVVSVGNLSNVSCYHVIIMYYYLC